MKNNCSIKLFRAALLLAAVSGIRDASGQNTENQAKAGENICWLTDPGNGIFFQPQPLQNSRGSHSGTDQQILVDDTQTYQAIDGFGYTLTGGSAIHINTMDEKERLALLLELFGTEGNQIGVSYLRLSIGASDLSDHLFSYNDLPAGQTDPYMERFSIDPERKDLLPVLKEILAINPDIKIMGSPWSPPVWMKDNQDTRGGSLLPEWYSAYARYFVKYIHAMQKEGIRIDAVTIQNEPLHPGNNPSLLMLPGEQAEFLKNHLGPAFREARIDTKILLYDHNADRIDYPISILNDSAARQYADGSAFHLYAGKIGDLSKVHEAHPDKNLYFTEQWVGAPGNFSADITWHVRELIIGATRNWCRTVLEWNLSSNPQLTPYTDRGGCSKCLGAVTIDGNKVTRNPAYYIIAHASKFIRPGSVRIASSIPGKLNNVAFKTPDDNVVVVVQNDSREPQQFIINAIGKSLTIILGEGAVGTYLFMKE
ncbi:MAG TPA: glycoside hydrolase family 30 beta sandwich domain-containing protein [Bacteroidales bacterium]|nr:glycoside hydrolase family 30 beta sandwich domain-containing protein [Bacteroidales bacterium]